MSTSYFRGVPRHDRTGYLFRTLLVRHQAFGTAVAYISVKIDLKGVAEKPWPHPVQLFRVQRAKQHGVEMSLFRDQAGAQT